MVLHDTDNYYADCGATLNVLIKRLSEVIMMIGYIGIITRWLGYTG